ncbi:MAG: glycosyl transferase [Rhizobiaceae bacterium]|nr:glycosyl transferase [Rhizobiaceae bacterium]
MIPHILHQTWKSPEIPERFRPWVESWEEFNPGWRRMFWTDRDLLLFVSQHYPEFLPTFCSYASGILRADAGRYLLLHHFGGVYADLDCECVGSFDPIMTEDRVVLCKEPSSHFESQASFRGLPYLLFNGTMASPPGHPFWMHLWSYLPTLVRAKEVIDATGPAVMTSAQLSFPDQSRLVIHASTLFTPSNRDGEPDTAEETTDGTLSRHHWAGTWWTPERSETRWDALKRKFYFTRYLLTRGDQLEQDEIDRSFDRSVIGRPPPPAGNVAVLVPVRDAAEHIEPFLAALKALDYPKERMKLVFCEGDSRDGSWERLKTAVEPLRAVFRDILLLQYEVGTRIDRKKRARPSLQRRRRTGLAKVRNHLIAKGIDASDDWALWIDIDVWKFPPDILHTLIGSGRRIVVPNCVLVPGGDTFDLNTFVALRKRRDYRYYRSVIGGLHQPPIHTPNRLALSDVRHLEAVDLHGVGGTMLLVDAALHRAGLLFPEKPYKDLVETEGFGVLARDLGVTPVGLPRVEILHVPW